MQFKQDGKFSDENVNALKCDFIDLLFCLNQKEMMLTSPYKRAITLSNDVKLALQLIENYLSKKLPQKDFLSFVEFVLNLYALLIQKAYLPNYHQYDEYKIFIINYERGTV